MKSLSKIREKIKTYFDKDSVHAPYAIKPKDLPLVFTIIFFTIVAVLVGYVIQKRTNLNPQAASSVRFVDPETLQTISYTTKPDVGLLITAPWPVAFNSDVQEGQVAGAIAQRGKGGTNPGQSKKSPTPTPSSTPTPTPSPSPSPTSTKGPSSPTPTPTSTPTPSPSPSPTSTKAPSQTVASIEIAEDSGFTQNLVSVSPVSSNPYYTTYTFSNDTLGTKTIYVRFVSSIDTVQVLTGTIELVDPTATIPPTVSVDFSQNQGLLEHRASGFIGDDFDNSHPSSTNLLPVKPRLLSWMLNYDGETRARQNNIKYQIKLWNMGSIPSTADGNWSTWENYVRNRAQEALNGNYSTVEFDIWNEPELSTYWSGGIDERYYQMWNRAYRTIKSVNPDFKVVGPSSNSYSWVRNGFLFRANADNTLPDILSWHEINNDIGGVLTRIQGMRSFMQSNGMNISEISINEYNTPGTSRSAAKSIWYISQLEQAQVDSASRACWEEVAGGTYDCAPHMDNTLSNGQPRSVWWAYKLYADMTGNLVSFVNSTDVKGLASQDSSTGKGYVLIGALASSSNLSISLTNLNNAPFNTGSSVNVTVQKVPNSGSNALPSPTTIQQSSMTPVDGSLIVSIPGVQADEAYLITLSR